MKKKLMSILLSAAMLTAMAAPAFAAEGDGEKTNAVYLGVQGYGTLNYAQRDENHDTVKDADGKTIIVNPTEKADFVHRFFVDGKEETYLVSAENNYAIQNILAEGYVFDITVADGVVTAAKAVQGVEGVASAAAADSVTVDGKEIAVAEGAKAYAVDPKTGGAVVTEIDLASVAGKTVKVYGDPAQLICQTAVARPYTPPVSGTPGLRTVKNYLATALEPVGTALYVYGGSWDWQDSNSSLQARTIGLPQSWVDYFQSQNADYSFKDWDDYSQTTYPFGSWNQYYYAGVDCSGYVGWSVYNVLNTQSFQEDQPYYVGSSTTRAKALAEAGFGERTREYVPADFKPGDVFSMSGHCWICLGACPDGSLVILHSTPSDNKEATGQGGGGVQISGLGTSPDCQAYQLAKFYMEKYYPQWSARYDAVCRDYDTYTSLSTSENTGKFSWTIGQAGLEDPDGYLGMTAEEILKDLFGETATLLPAEPETPAEPEQPAEPETPAEPEQPAEPETPAEPEQPAEPETPAEPSAGTYTVQEGDTLGVISLNFYGSYAYSKALQQANAEVFRASKGKLVPGMVLNLPDTLGKAARLSAPAAGEGESLYTVKAGDTLGKIAQAVYGSAQEYEAIFARNSDRLKDANTIFAGQIIVLPARG